MDERAPEVLFGSERIMGPTSLGQIPRAWITTLRVCVNVVELEEASLSAPLTRVVDKGAAGLVAIPYLAPHRRRRGHALARSVCMHFAFNGVDVDGHR